MFDAGATRATSTCRAARSIQRVELRYRNLVAGAQAKVERSGQ